MSELSDAFQEAKKCLNTGYDHTIPYYICFALRFAVDAGHISHFIADQATRIITKRLDGWRTVEEWLYKNVKDYRLEHGGTDELPPHRRGCMRTEVQAYRHRWLDSLIEEFK